MFDLGARAKVLAVVAVSAVLLVGCSSGGSPDPVPAPPAPPPPPVAAPPVVPPGETSEAALTIAEASADPTLGFVLGSGVPVACLESEGGPRPGVGTVLDGRVVSAGCRETEGQVWSFQPLPDGTFRLVNRDRVGDLCLEGGPAIAPDSAANTACRPSPSQAWHVVPTTAGYYRLGTVAPEPRCLGVLPPAPDGPGPAEADEGTPLIAMAPCESPQPTPGAPRTSQDWEITPGPLLPEPEPEPTTTTPPPPTETEPAPSGPVDELLAQVNSERARAGCGPVRRDARLDRSAEAHARWMNSPSGQFSHTGENGTSPSERMSAQGWSGGSGENIARGQGSVDEVMTDWMNSPGHRRNIEDCEWTSVGLARTGSTWVQNFGG